MKLVLYKNSNILVLIYFRKIEILLSDLADFRKIEISAISF